MRFLERKTRRMFGRHARAGRASILTLVVGAGSVALLSAASGYVLSAATAQAPAAAARSAATTRAVLDQYCVTCHNERVVRGEREPPSVLVSHCGGPGSRSTRWTSPIRVRMRTCGSV